MAFVNRKLFLAVILLLKFVIDVEPSANDQDLNGKMMKLLTSCFADGMKAIITTPNIAEQFFLASIEIPLIMIDENFVANSIQRYLPYSGNFVLSTKSFETLLNRLKYSPWWSIDALFFIIGNSRDGCEPAAEILKRAWNMNLLSTMFICWERGAGAMIYTYNPYTNRAPHPWREVVGFNRPDDRWTLYMQHYHEGLENCECLNFDKTKFMDGYEVKTVTNAKHGVDWIENKNYGIDSLRYKHTFIAVALFWQTLFPVMNMTAIVYYDNPGYLQDGQPVGFLGKLINGSYDISLSGRYAVRDVRDVRALYPFIQPSPSILTQQQKFLSPGEKILSYYSIEIRYLIGIVLLITFLFLVIINRNREYSLAVLNVLRMLLSGVVFAPFNRLATRLFFFGIFQLIIIINVTFQGHFAAFLTKPERHYVDSMKELMGYNVLAPQVIQAYLDDIRIDIETINYLSGVSCIEHVINDPNVACIQSTQAMLEPAIKHKLHISQSKLPEVYLVFWCRKDWPLMKKFDHYALRFIEAGIYEYFFDHNVNIPMRKLTRREIDETSARYRPIELLDLFFAFRMLARCFGISILVFAIELLPWRKILRLIKRSIKITRTKSSTNSASRSQ